jgi:hypothetical protein
MAPVVPGVNATWGARGQGKWMAREMGMLVLHALLATRMMWECLGRQAHR